MEMKDYSGTGVAKKAGARVLNNIELPNGDWSPASEGFYKWSTKAPVSLEDVVEWFQVKDAKGRLVNAIYVTNEAGDKVALDADACIVSVVAGMICDKAKSLAYQKVLAKFKPAEDPAVAREKLIRIYLSMGFTEELATRKADEAIAENAQREADAAKAEAEEVSA